MRRLTCLLIAVLLACGGGPSGTEDGERPVAEVTVLPDSLYVLEGTNPGYEEVATWSCTDRTGTERLLLHGPTYLRVFGQGAEAAGQREYLVEGLWTFRWRSADGSDADTISESLRRWGVWDTAGGEVVLIAEDGPLSELRDAERNEHFTAFSATFATRLATQCAGDTVVPGPTHWIQP